MRFHSRGTIKDLFPGWWLIFEMRAWHVVNVSACDPISSLDSCMLGARKIRLRQHQIRRAVNGRNKPQHVLLNHKTQHHCKEFDNEKLMFLEKEAEQKKDNWWKSKSRKILWDTILISFLYVSCINMMRKLKWQNCHEVVVCLCSLNPCIESMCLIRMDARVPPKHVQHNFTCLPFPRRSNLYKTCTFLSSTIWAAKQPPEKSQSVSQWFVGGPTVSFFDPILYSPKVSHFSPTGNTVDGGNPTPLDIVNISLFTWFHTPDRWCRISSLQRRIPS